MERPTRFEHSRWVGDKRSQVVHDLDHADDHAEEIEELVAAKSYSSLAVATPGIAFGPDTLTEARNRGYHLCKKCAAAGAADDDGDA